MKLITLNYINFFFLNFHLKNYNKSLASNNNFLIKIKEKHSYYIVVHSKKKLNNLNLYINNSSSTINECFDKKKILYNYIIYVRDKYIKCIKSNILLIDYPYISLDSEYEIYHPIFNFKKL
jgi:hypothetical protein